MSCKYKSGLLHAQKAIEDSFLADIQFPNGLPSYIPAQTFSKIRKYLMITSSYYLHNMIYLDRHLLYIADKNVTYMGDFLQPYYQDIRSYNYTDATSTAIEYSLITSEAHNYTTATPPYLYVTSNLRAEDHAPVDSTVP